MAAANVGPGGCEAVVLADVEKLSVFPAVEQREGLVEQDAYESTVKDAWLADAAVGDVNGDGVRDVVAVETRKATLEILTIRADGTLVKATAFQVFQGKRFRDEPDRGGELREVLVGDVTGDRIDDIVLIVHDRLIIYPGE
jgi:hypothetical protein